MRNQQSKGQWAMDFFVRAPMSNKKILTQKSLIIYGTAFLLISSKQFLNESFLARPFQNAIFLMKLLGEKFQKVHYLFNGGLLSPLFSLTALKASNHEFLIKSQS